MGLQKCPGQAFSLKHLHETFLGWTCEEVESHPFHPPNNNKKRQTTGQINTKGIIELRLQSNSPPTHTQYGEIGEYKNAAKISLPEAKEGASNDRNTEMVILTNY